jgi:small conductance mechanosensitive channel
MSQIIKKVARPDLIRATTATIVALIALALAHSLGDPEGANLVVRFRRGEFRTDPNISVGDWMALASTIVFALSGIFATRKVNAGVGKALEERFGDARGAPLGLVLSIVGYALLLLTLLDLIGVDLGGLLLGGAITGIVVGIAAQQTLANMFAGIVLIAVRPFVVGDHIVLRSGPLGGEYNGRVTDIGLFYVDLVTEFGPVKLPNAGVLAGSVGPGARQPKYEGEQDEEPTAPPSEGGAPRA